MCIGKADFVAFVAATIYSSLFPFLALLLRLWARYNVGGMSLKKPLWEDTFLCIAMVFKLALDADGIILLKNGLGCHIETLSPSEILNFVKTQYTGSFFYPLCVACVKLSVISQLTRLFIPYGPINNRAKILQRSLYTLAVAVVGWCLAIIISAFVICVPLPKFWDPDLKGTCIDLGAFYYGMQIPNVLTDFLLVGTPIGMILSLNLSKWAKLRSIAMFMLGVITIVFDIKRLVVMIEFNQSDRLLSDVTYYVVQPAIWTTVEPATTMIAACVPSVSALKSKRSPKGYTNESKKEILSEQSAGSVYNGDSRRYSTTTDVENPRENESTL